MARPGRVAGSDIGRCDDCRVRRDVFQSGRLFASGFSGWVFVVVPPQRSGVTVGAVGFSVWTACRGASRPPWIDSVFLIWAVVVVLKGFSPGDHARTGGVTRCRARVQSGGTFGSGLCCAVLAVLGRVGRTPGLCRLEKGPDGRPRARGAQR
jgi:hypothetical protein